MKNNNLINKKLLIMGANAETTPLVEMANKMGVKTLVTSNKKDDPAKKTAWKACDVDGLDVPGLIALARDEEVDGVLVGVADILVPAYCKVCDALGFPCYATEDIVNVFSYKDTFKATFERFGIHGIPEFYLDESLNDEDINDITFPVMVKPVDSYSGLGMTVCSQATQLNEAVKKALEASRKKRFIVERYMECDDVGIYYTFKDGECSMSCMFDRYTAPSQNGSSRVSLGGIYPSKHIKDYYNRMHSNAVRLFRSIGIENGVLLLQAFFEDGEFFVYDMGFRLQGEAPHLLMNAINGFDQRELLIKFALTGSEGELDLASIDDAYFKGKAAATLWFLSKAGTISAIDGMDKVKSDNRIVANIQRFFTGDSVLPEWVGTEKQVFTRLYIVCENMEELKDVIDYYRANIHVYSENGESMLLDGFDSSVILKG